MRIQLNLRQDGTGSIKLYPCKTKGNHINLFHSVDIYIDSHAEVNWSGCGAQTPEMAAQYAEGLTEASLLASRINKHVLNGVKIGMDRALCGYITVSQEEHNAYWAEKEAVTSK